MKVRLFAAAVGLTASAALATAADWTQFRGTDGTGV